MKRSTLINSTFASLVFLAFTTTATQAQTQFTLSTYAAKFVCGKSEKIASPGQYFTMINVHNASPLKKAAYLKRFAIALPEERPGKISEFVGGTLAPEEAMTIDCENIYKHTQVPSGQFLKALRSFMRFRNWMWSQSIRQDTLRSKVFILSACRCES